MHSLITSKLVAASAMFMFLLLGNVECGTSPELNYTCTPYGVITVVNPNATNFLSVEATTTDGPCNASLTPTNEEVIIRNCNIASRDAFRKLAGKVRMGSVRDPTDKSNTGNHGSMNETISLVFSPDVAGIPTIITSAVKFYSILCEEIPYEGITKRVVDESWVTHLIFTSLAPTVTPNIDLESRLIDNGTDTLKTSVAMIGEPVRWEITGPIGYTILPLNCSAYSGDPSGNSTQSVHIIQNGCTLDAALISNFEYTTEPNVLIATIITFRFVDSADLRLQCDVRGCPTLSTACDISCPSVRRRRVARDIHTTVPSKRAMLKSSVGRGFSARLVPFLERIGVRITGTERPLYTVIDRPLYVREFISGSPSTTAARYIVLLTLVTHLAIGS